MQRHPLWSWRAVLTLPGRHYYRGDERHPAANSKPDEKWRFWRGLSNFSDGDGRRHPGVLCQPGLPGGRGTGKVNTALLSNAMIKLPPGQKSPGLLQYQRRPHDKGVGVRHLDKVLHPFDPGTGD